MIRSHNNPPSPDFNTASWEDDGGCVGTGSPQRDLNSLLAEEQTSIMNAESATTPAAYELHRDASLHIRRQINATAYPEHEPHCFDRERPETASGFDESLAALIKTVEGNERVLARQFADGKVSAKSFRSRSRSLRQDRSRLLDPSRADHGEKSS